MSNTSVRPIPTLKGIFSVPRVTQSRNFLKENKVSLRSLEKSTSQKLAAKEPARPKWMPPLRRTSSEMGDSKAEKPVAKGKPVKQNSLQNGRSTSRSQHQLAVAVPAEGERFDGLEERNPILYDPSEGCEAENLLEPSLDTDLDRCQSCGTNRSSTSIAIQTEDITDELYLTNALKKCNFDARSILEESATKYGENYKPMRYENEEDLEQLPLSARSNSSKKSRFNMSEMEAMPMTEAEPANYGASDDEAPLSARSRFTTASNVTTISSKSKRREHKLGSRDEVRLPRYLEKQKREKAVAKQLAESLDPDCPRGHVLLSDQDRLTHLTNAKKRYEQLVNELNHMPMTAQTLRVRNRKAEIDKELTTVEEDIRIYSKAKVFVLASKSRQL
ncbi:uncharacterized protein LOC6733370 [Drosophila simulans]|uniref:GD10481 n=1 Tax=Drosophila simulans TaxID=7240 RepID=B4QEA3_DROSI|nr:uncharacterized protein LOC6733370 [Drosophila simulans]EDX06012.1 GD10481 [Drosophila simulans]KMY91976.1 uncharacterized protein Dsimw501_GD10481 [Drosophila simulans]